jgi:hypothetical protein
MCFYPKTNHTQLEISEERYNTLRNAGFTDRQLVRFYEEGCDLTKATIYQKRKLHKRFMTYKRNT